MSEVLHRLREEIMPIVDMIVFIILFIVGLFVFSYFLIIGTVIGLALFVIAFIHLKIDQHKRQKKSPFSKIIEHDETEEN